MPFESSEKPPTPPEEEGEEEKEKVEEVEERVEEEIEKKPEEVELEKEEELPRYEFLQIDLKKPLEEQPYDFGIEVTLPGAKNDLDHHGPEDTSETPSACEQALELEEEKIPPKGAKIGFLRPDGDTFAAVAVLELRAEGRKFNSEIVKAVGTLDRKGPKEAEEKYIHLREEIVAILRVAADPKIPLSLEERIKFIKKVLEENPEIKKEVQRLTKERDEEFEKAKRESEVKVTPDGKIAQVISKHRFAMSLGYEEANIVIATNPEMLILKKTPEGKLVPTGETYLKHTIARISSFVPLDMKGLVEELNKIEQEKGGRPNWGGRGDIIGSPMEISSKISSDELIKIARKYIPK